MVSERNQRCGGETRPELEARRAELGGGWFLGRGLNEPSPPARESGDEHCKLPSWIRGEAPAGGRQQFWYILGSSGELFHRPAMQNCVYVQAYDLLNFNAHVIQFNYA